jgi:hypothetical protein
MLAADGKASSVTDASVAADFGKALDVHSNFTAKVTFYQVLALNDFTEFLNFFVGQISAAGIRIDACLLEDLVG